MLKAVVSMLAASVTLLTSAALAQSNTPSVTIARSRAGDAPFRAAGETLQSRGYVEVEHFVSGTARGAAAEGQPVTSAPYRTRILVRRPSDPGRFNGVVVVEWLNVSAGLELEMGWPMFDDALIRDGYAWIGVSAQPIGTGFLKQWRPSRYGSLRHPGLSVIPEPLPNGRTFITGETWSFDIFGQVASLLRGKHGARLFGKLPKTLIAFGGSQSEQRLLEFMSRARTGHKRPFDGYFLNVGGLDASFGQSVDVNLGRADRNVASIPASPEVPVFLLNSEREVLLNFARRRPDSRTFRYWEVAGSGHFSRLAQETAQRKALREIPALSGVNGTRCGDMLPGPVGVEYVARAVIKHLTTWIQDGVEPPHADPVATVEISGAVQIARDKFGNALGGVRLPLVDVPTGRILGSAAPASAGILCENIAGFVPFSESEIDRLYPSHYDYVNKVSAAADAAVKAGYLLPVDAELIIQQAESAEIGELRTPVLAPRGSWKP